MDDSMNAILKDRSPPSSRGIAERGVIIVTLRRSQKGDILGDTRRTKSMWKHS